MKNRDRDFDFKMLAVTFFCLFCDGMIGTKLCAVFVGIIFSIWAYCYWAEYCRK